jgi:hypothetical protein
MVCDFDHATLNAHSVALVTSECNHVGNCGSGERTLSRVKAGDNTGAGQ